MSTAMLLGAALAVVCVVLVALPFLREPAPVSDELDELTRSGGGGSHSRRSATALSRR